MHCKKLLFCHRDEQMHTKCLVVFVTAACLAALLQGCGKKAAREDEGIIWDGGCTVKKALATLLFGGKLRTIEEFSSNENCKFKKIKAPNGCKEWLEGHGDQLAIEEAPDFLAMGATPLGKDTSVVLDCQEEHEALCLEFELVAYYDTYKSPVLSKGSPCVQVRDLQWPQTFPDSASLIQHVDVKLTKSKNSADLQRANATTQVVTAAQGQQLIANTTAKSHLPVYRIPRTKHATDDAVVREMKKMSPEALAVYHVEERT